MSVSLSNAINKQISSGFYKIDIAGLCENLTVSSTNKIQFKDLLKIGSFNSIKIKKNLWLQNFSDLSTVKIWSY